MPQFDQKVRHRDTALHSDAVRSHLARHAEQESHLMGLTDEQYLKRLANLTPPTPTTTLEASPKNVVESTTIGNELTLRGIPVVGAVGGAITGTRPGDSATALAQASEDVRAVLMAKARANLKQARR